MMVWVTPVLVAVIGGPLMWLLARLDRNNTDQHNSVIQKIEKIDDNVVKLRNDLSEHIVWHMQEEHDLRKQMLRERREKRREDHRLLYEEINEKADAKAQVTDV